MSTRVWDTHEIKAELARRGWTLTRLALENGLPENACRRALSASCLPGAEAIAAALGVSVQELFPGRYIKRRHGDTATGATLKASQKRAVRSDTEVAA